MGKKNYFQFNKVYLFVDTKGEDESEMKKKRKLL